MKTSARAIDEPRRGSSLVFSMMMILSAMSAGLSGIPLANATGNGEMVHIDMEKGHWENGEDVTATVKADGLGTGDYSVWYNVETINGTEATNATVNISDTDGDGVEEFTVTVSANDLWDECWNIYADLLDSSGSMIAGSSFTFDVGSGMCPGNPTGPHFYWDGDYSWSTDDSVLYTAEINNLDETKSYTLDWALHEMGLSEDLMNGSEDLSGQGASFAIDIYIGQLGDGCYEISGELIEDDGKEVQGGMSMYMFEVGTGTCSGPQMFGAYVHHYDGEVSISAWGFVENQTNLNIQVSITNENGDESFVWGDDFTADEYGMFMTEQCCLDEDGEYSVYIVITDTTDDSTLFESWDMTLYVGDGGGGGDDAGISVWTQNQGYSSGDDVYIDYWAWGNDGDYLEIWDCQVQVLESALQGDTSLENIEAVAATANEPEWCGGEVDWDSVDVGQDTGNDPFNGETVWITDEGMVASFTFDGDLNLSVTMHSVPAEFGTIEEFCEMMSEYGDDSTYDSATDTCSFVETFVKFDVGTEYIYEEVEEINPDWNQNFVCDGNNTYLPFHEVNDGYEDCEDGSDEPQDFDGDGVTDNWFDCHDGSTVSMDVVNDGVEDCADGEDEVSFTTEVDSDYTRYVNDGTHFILGGIEDYSEQLYDIVIEVYDEDGNQLTSINVYGDEDDIVLSGLDDGKYDLVGKLVDADGTVVYTSESTGFCIGECDHGGEGPDMLTGNASLDLTVIFDDYDADNCFGGFVMLFDWYDLYMNMIYESEGGDDEGDEPQPVWMDWQSVTGPGYYTLTGLPEGDWVVIVSIGCQDPDTGEDYGAMNIDGPFSIYNTTFVNGTTSTLDAHLEVHDGPDHGDDGGDWEEPVHVEFWIKIVDDADGNPTLYLTMVGHMSDSWRTVIDLEMGDGDGMVSETEANNFIAMMELAESMEEDDGESDECPFDDVHEDSPCNNMDCMNPESAACQQAVMDYCNDAGTTDPACDNMGGDDGPDIPEFAWNGIPLTKDDIISQTMEFSGLVGAVPTDPSADTFSVKFTQVSVLQLLDSGDLIQVLSPYSSHHGDNGDEDCPFDMDNADSPCFEPACEEDHESQGCMAAIEAYCAQSEDPACDFMSMWEFYDSCSFDADRMNDDYEDGLYWCDEGDGDEIWWYWCEPTPEEAYRCTDEFGWGNQPDHGDGEEPNIEEIMEMFDLDGDGAITVDEIIDFINQSAADDGEDGLSEEDIEWINAKFNDFDSNGNGVLEADEFGPFLAALDGDDGDDHGDDHGPCSTGEIYIQSSEDWDIISAEGLGVDFTYDAAAGHYYTQLACMDDAPEEGNMSFSRVADEPEPEVNQPPYCDVYFYDEVTDMGGTLSTDDKADGSNNTWEISIVEDGTYWLMFYCIDEEGDSITVNITSTTFGNYGETFDAGSTEGHYELTIPTGSSLLSPYTLDYTWTDGTNSGSGTVTATIAPSDGGSDGGGEETASEDTGAGSFVPGFTAVLTMTALAGALLVFSRRED